MNQWPETLNREQFINALGQFLEWLNADEKGSYILAPLDEDPDYEAHARRFVDDIDSRVSCEERYGFTNPELTDGKLAPAMLGNREHEALRKWMADATEVLANLLPEVHMPGKRAHLETVITQMDQHAAVFGAASSEEAP